MSTNAISLPAVVYLRGAGAGEYTWGRMQEAVAARGWFAVRDFTSAWHLNRGGAIVIQCDFTPIDGEGHAKHTVLVQRVRARYSDEVESPIGEGHELVKAKHSVSPGRQGRPTEFKADARNREGELGAVVLDVNAVMDMIQAEVDAKHARASVVS